ncbi:hypothetical protein WMY93_020062 [Mugilogobius chulae]|uniref:Uncharacterized protein n=1 Tax=Mugilogobius chulae TaxID=88201 RepID=A0AAW0NTH4_9GOBI
MLCRCPVLKIALMCLRSCPVLIMARCLRSCPVLNMALMCSGAELVQYDLRSCPVLNMTLMCLRSCLVLNMTLMYLRSCPVLILTHLFKQDVDAGEAGTGAVLLDSLNVQDPGVFKQMLGVILEISYSKIQFLIPLRSHQLVFMAHQMQVRGALGGGRRLRRPGDPLLLNQEH